MHMAFRVAAGPDGALKHEAQRGGMPSPGSHSICIYLHLSLTSKLMSICQPLGAAPQKGGRKWSDPSGNLSPGGILPGRRLTCQLC
jgi:hypothetical protein